MQFPLLLPLLLLLLMMMMMKMKPDYRTTTFFSTLFSCQNTA